MIQKGFTLIEILISLSIIIALTFFLAYLVFYQYWLYNTQNAEIDIINNARLALNTIDDYVRQSNEVLSSYSTYQTNSQTVILQLNSIDASSQIISGSYDTVVCYLSGTDLLIQLFPDQNSSRVAFTKKLATNIDVNNFSFAYDDPNYSSAEQVTTNLAISVFVPSFEQQNKSISLSSKSKLRNH